MFCYYVNRTSSVSTFGRGGIRTSNFVYFTRPASVEFSLFLLASQRSTPIRDWPSRVRWTWWPLHYRNLQSWLILSFPSHASWNTNQTADCVALFNLQLPSIFSSKPTKGQCSAGILKTFVFASTTALSTVFVPLGRKAFVVLSSSSTES